MRSGQRLFLVSAALFVSAIAFLVAAARNPRQAASAPRPVAAPVATIKQIMNAIVMPSANVLYNAVGSSSTAAGIVEIAPKNEAEWAAVAASAAALVEAGGLMLDERAIDRGDWVAMTGTFRDAAQAALKAANDKTADGIFMSGGDLAATCDKCHERYQRR
jgi:cytochrome c556